MANDINTKALMTIVDVLKDLDSDAQKRTLAAVMAFLDIQLPNTRSIFSGRQQELQAIEGVSFTEDRSISAKDFLRDKSPITDLERIACLAYYLTHYRNQPHFKTVDLSTLNTEAAQPKFSNATLAANNALTAGLLVQAGKGSKQISSAGETFVQLLPDRDAAKTSLKSVRKRKAKKNKSSKSES
jgi:hypothetical protein